VNPALKTFRWLGCVTLILLLPCAMFAADARYKLIAHRGGVVENKFPDNSPAAFRAAVERGYWGIEVDIRESKDGVLVMQHDPDLKLNFGDPRQIIDLTWEELSRLRTKVGNQPLWRFEDVVQAARAAGVKLMLDSKAPHGPDFPAKLEAALKAHDLVASCYVIGTGDAMEHFKGKALVGWKSRPLTSRIEADPAQKAHICLFDEGRNLTVETAKWALARGVRVVVSINVYHYHNAVTMAGKPAAEVETLMMAAAKRDVEKFQAIGVTEFQIDSEFDRWF
jgi:glycerophosphoryl diester phosphodiesterase